MSTQSLDSCDWSMAIAIANQDRDNCLRQHITDWQSVIAISDSSRYHRTTSMQNDCYFWSHITMLIRDCKDWSESVALHVRDSFLRVFQARRNHSKRNVFEHESKRTRQMTMSIMRKGVWQYHALQCEIKRGVVLKANIIQMPSDANWKNGMKSGNMSLWNGEIDRIGQSEQAE